MGADFGKSRGEGGHTANPFRGGYGYFLEPHIKYLRGREMVTADTLSHLSSLDEFEVLVI